MQHKRTRKQRTARTFDSTARQVAQYDAHAGTARSMLARGERTEAVNYLKASGWHAEVAQEFVARKGRLVLSVEASE